MFVQNPVLRMSGATWPFVPFRTASTIRSSFVRNTNKLFTAPKNMKYQLIMNANLLLFSIFFFSLHCLSKYVSSLHTQTSKSCLDGICDDTLTGGENELVVLKLRPGDLPPPVLFHDWSGSENKTIILPYNNGTAQVVATGHLAQPGLDTQEPFYSSFAVLPDVVPRSIVAQVLSLLRGGDESTPGSTALPLDLDPDSVDGMSTQEIFLDNDNLRRGEPSKGVYPEDTVQRSELRQKLRKLLDPILDGKITPYVRQRYAERCGEEKPGRSCTPCYSLIRRYRAGERISHAPHHDGHAFATVVISLSDYGTEYRGGLYVASKFNQRYFLALNRGDAVVHQGDLYHGVQILENITLDQTTTDSVELGQPSPQASERWSWILWMRDSNTCEDHKNTWYQSCAIHGNPTCQLLHASSVQHSDEVVYWNQQASDNGHGAASVKLARAYLKLLPSSLSFDYAQAKKLFQRAVDLTDEPDGHYGLAHLYLAEISLKKQSQNMDVYNNWHMSKALSHLESAAKGYHPFAMFNLGIAHLYGYGYPDSERDMNLAGEWFEASGLPEGLFIRSMHLDALGKNREAEMYRRRAALLGYGSPWRKAAREQTGSGGAGGVSLNLPWPISKFGNKPDEF